MCGFSTKPMIAEGLEGTSNMGMRICRISKQSLAPRWDRVMVGVDLHPADEGSSHKPLVIRAIMRGSQCPINCRSGWIIQVNPHAWAARSNSSFYNPHV
ncbi:hypothetical protein AVEN_13717-1 [Araneus ventricosus]|uniref:Uncharacterized protein n=1 Tax=Araneus ventricosus TaxID=182803 RepID=A0A4Y2KGC3_ARAVE|nr:hypothetical protein AVEN_270075-1 [Araneus ventricosus]GBN01059.1 hypothetical protein AVEN_13717-1 [Araneus ventricosus]